MRSVEGFFGHLGVAVYVVAPGTVVQVDDGFYEVTDERCVKDDGKIYVTPDTYDKIKAIVATKWVDDGDRRVN